ncbi:MAG: Na-translocating system protein MpsC family protein [Eubacteriales bacterium]|nr:DUF2294 domain-containing protein [Bacillota bacterium]MBV1726525.1 DUF2294 domain-containing protein [Desulforudis sp.]MDP3050582.1 Na-translocating system protein MpsC family protein [Eubacteriales bacterium]MDQ7789958.1 Na-translocating system protein MpsC family protein [Clostridia bacterium]MBU4554424.1 DUF2294 domain-containing protein [Bacillota bacterium]
MGQAAGIKVALIEGTVRSIAKKLYGKGPQNVRCTYPGGGVFIVRCEGVLSPLEKRLADEGGDEAVRTLKKIRYSLFVRERQLLSERLLDQDIRVETVLQDFCLVKDECIMVVVTEGY